MAIPTEEYVAPYITREVVINYPMATLSSMLYVYGLYTILFGSCLRILIQRRDRPNRNLYLAWTIILFVLTTAANVVQAYHQVRQASIDFDAAKTREYHRLVQYLAKDTFKTAYIVLLQVLPLLIVITADTMLIHRCYTIWGCRKRVVLPLIAALSVTHSLVFAAAVMEGIGMYNSKDKWRWALFDKAALISAGGWNAGAGLNMILTGLTAGRIWWISRQARSILSQAVNRQYTAIVAIILESGVIYPVLQIAYIIMLRITDPARKGNIPVDLFPVVYQTAGIAPTLIIVRAASGRAIESVDQAVSTLRFGDGVGVERSTLRTVDLPSEGATAAMRGEDADVKLEKGDIQTSNSIV
ncbi:hypothetical protein WG66_005970 [Moniliophthora roreri]|nr:hypothetical protein WG66_005970 [Moniliophthora roreri]